VRLATDKVHNWWSFIIIIIIIIIIITTRATWDAVLRLIGSMAARSTERLFESRYVPHTAGAVRLSKLELNREVVKCDASVTSCLTT
jgi:hypothetical protein